MDDISASFIMFILCLFAFIGLLSLLSSSADYTLGKQCQATYGIEADYIEYRDRSMCVYPSEGKLQAVYKED